MKYLVDAYVSDPASGGKILKTLTVEADEVDLNHGASVFISNAPVEATIQGVKPGGRGKVLVRIFAPGIWTQIQPEPEIARRP